MRIRVSSDSKSLWEEMRRQAPDQPSYCGGRGSCGKCRVRVTQGMASVELADRMHLTETEIEAGWRIACQSRPLTDCVIELEESREADMAALSVTAEADRAGNFPCSVAVDIGTTTLAFALLDAEGRVLASETGLNHQRSFGADVVSRIELAMSGREAELTACIRRDVRDGISALLQRSNVPLLQVSHIVAAGNTVMEQLFFGLPVKSLGAYPFTPFTGDFIETEYGRLFGEPEPWEEGGLCIPVTGFPCIAGFVGGDITAGLYEVMSGGASEPAMLLDIGTNGELACITRKGILTASTAAGPVFEGGGIRCGMGSLPGAICRTCPREDFLECGTIGNAPPEGICGSGLIEAVADLRQLGVIDRQGLMKAAWRDKGYLLARSREGRELVLTQADLREFQMAKAAIAAGVELLCRQAGTEPEKIAEFYLAGGLGSGLEVKKAARVGLLPQAAVRRCRPIGNASLRGAIRLAAEGEAGRKRIRELLSVTGHLHLANTEGFEECYIRHMEL